MTIAASDMQELGNRVVGKAIDQDAATYFLSYGASTAGKIFQLEFQDTQAV